MECDGTETGRASRMKRTALALVVASLALTACLSKVSPEQRANDAHWRQTSEQLSRPTTLN